ncbi:MAG TPA: DEAD/DEAH box helicase, partial [Candidatus Dojkabacteria bacterium]
NAYKGQYAWDLDGSSNLDILQRILRENCMVRRLKSEVLPELPEKIRRVIELPNDEKRAEGEWNSYRKHQNHIDEIEAKMELAKADENENEYRRQVDALKSAMNFAFEAMASIRHETALYKIPAAIEFIKDALEGGPIVCFAHHKKVIEALKEAFPNSSVLVGDTPLDKRQQAVDDFQSGKTDLFIGSIKAVGLGNTLTASSHAVFIEGDWTPSWVFQAEDRLHRIGQKNSVLIDHLVLEDSIECHIAKTMLDKQRVIELALDKGDILSFLKEEPIVPTKRKRIIYSADEEINLTEEQINNIHHAVQIVAGMCDGAIARDGSGFNAFDTSIGKSLAGRVALTKKQAKLAQGLVQKYQGQLPIELVKSCDIIPKEEKKK